MKEFDTKGFGHDSSVRLFSLLICQKALVSKLEINQILLSVRSWSAKLDVRAKNNVR